MHQLVKNSDYYQDARYVREKKILVDTVELHLSELIVTVKLQDLHTIRTIGFFFENRLHWQLEVRLLLFTVCTCV